MQVPSGFKEKSQKYNDLCELNQRYADIAASIQKITEELILGVCFQAYKETKCSNLCLRR